MNITEYRAMKAQESAQKEPEQPIKETTPPVETTPPEPSAPATPPVVEDKPIVEDKTPEVPAEPQKINVDGIGEVTIQELKNGYLRQSDYTRKTQDVAKQRREMNEAIQLYENLKRNPALAQQLAEHTPVPPTLDPTTAKVVELETKLYDMMLQREIETLSNKYEDFDARQVLQVASDLNIVDVESAYTIWKSKQPVKAPEVPSVDINAIKEQLRQEILNEIQSEQKATSTIISSTGGASPVKDNSPKLSETEIKVAKMMKMSPEEYAKWRDKKVR